jgi:hypothetical protein
MTSEAKLSVSASAVTSVDDLVCKTGHPEGRLYALFDACGVPAIPEKIRDLKERAVSLYRGQAAEDYWAIAPYLVEVDDSLLEWITKTLVGVPWGILVVSDGHLHELWRHFRKFLMVRLPHGDEAYFRFYDPRVLPPFLEACNAKERAAFFGPVHSYLLPHDDVFTNLILNESTLADTGIQPHASAS